MLESALLFGSSPPKPLRQKFFLAGESVAKPLTADVLPAGFSLLPLGGHAPDMVGIRTPDDVLFVGDAVSSPETLAKYRVTYTFDVGRALASLEALRVEQAALFLPAHAEPTADITALVDANIAATRSVVADILAILDTPKTHEQLLKELFDKYGLSLNFGQFGLVGATLRAYLAWLFDEGRVVATVQDNYLCYQAV